MFVNKMKKIKLNKKGALETKEIIELVLAAAGIFILLFLFFKLFAPSFDKNQETAKSYFDTLKNEIAKADNKQIGEFSLWQKDGFALVYFGDKRTFINNDGTLFSIDSFGEKNQVCICYNYKVKGNTPICNENSCTSLENPVELSGWNSPQFAILTWKLKIEKIDNKYIFTKIG
jgi:hypothetical protein